MTRTENSKEATAGRQLRYDVIQNRLRSAITEQRIQLGLVLLEGPVAEVFGTSRIPVRKAFELLAEEGFLRKFDGRGYLVARPGAVVEPLRLPINEISLGQDLRDATINIPSEADRIYAAFEESVSTCVVFGHFRIDESRAAEHFKVNRAAVREVLSRLVDRGLVEKSVYAAWRAGPLTARAISHDFELRQLLAPVALLGSGPLVDPQLLASLQASLVAGAPRTIDTLLRVERQIHGDCLAKYPNTKMLSVLSHSQMPLIVNQVFCRLFSQQVNPALWAEYESIVGALNRQDWPAAARGMSAHLEVARKRALQQLKALAVLPEPGLPDYLVRVS